MATIVVPSYAIVETGGKQYRAEKGTSLVVEHLSADQGAKVSLRAVMYRGDNEVVLEGDRLEKVKVEAVVAEHLRGPKLRVFKYKPKKGYRRTAGHRQELTRLEVTDVKLLTRKPAAKAEAEPAEKAEAKPTATGEAGGRRSPRRRSPRPRSRQRRSPQRRSRPPRSPPPRSRPAKRQVPATRRSSDGAAVVIC